MQQHIALLRVPSPTGRGSWRQQRMLGQRYQLGFASRWQQGGQTWFGFAATGGIDLALAVRKLLGGQRAQGVYLAYQGVNQDCAVIIWRGGELLCSVMMPLADLAQSLAQWLSDTDETSSQAPLCFHSVGFSPQQQQQVEQSINLRTLVSWQHHSCFPKKLPLRGCHLRAWKFGQDGRRARWTIVLGLVIALLGCWWWLSQPAPVPTLSASALAEQQQAQQEHAQYLRLLEHGVSPAAMVTRLPWLLRFSHLATWQLQEVSLASKQLHLTLQSRFPDLRNLSTLQTALVKSPARWQVKGGQVLLHVPLEQLSLAELMQVWSWQPPQPALASLLAQLPQQLRAVIPSIGSLSELSSGLMKTPIELQISQQSWLELEALLLLLGDYPIRITNVQLQRLPHGWQGQLQLDLITRQSADAVLQSATMKE